MSFTKSFLMSLCLTVTTSLHLGDECVDNENGLKGKCEEIQKCNYVYWKYYEKPTYCDLAANQICCPPKPVKGDECEDITSRRNGKCQNLLDCNYALKYRRIPTYCKDSSVCCPPVQLRKSEEMCFNYFHRINYPFDIERSTSDSEYTEKNIQVDDVETDNVIVDRKTILKKSSHMAVIGFDLIDSTIRWLCGGSIISPFFILSAANHCVEIESLGPAKWVRIGDLDVLNSIESANHQDFRIVKSFVHPDYTSSSHYNNIALFKLEKEIIFGVDFQPACLHTTRNVPQRMETTLWTLGRFMDNPRYHLVKELNVVEYELCETKFRDNEKLPKGVVDELQICAWEFSNKDTHGSYFGGLLQYKVEEFGNIRGHYVVAGIPLHEEDWLYDYTDITQVFTRVSPYLDWIEEIIWEDEIELETVTFVFSN